MRLFYRWEHLKLWNYSFTFEEIEKPNEIIISHGPREIWWNNKKRNISGVYVS